MSVKIKENNNITIICDQCNDEINAIHFTEEPYELNKMLSEAYRQISGYGWELGEDPLHYDKTRNLCRSCNIKSKDKNYFINMAVDDYNTTFNKSVKPHEFSIEYINSLMRSYKYWSMVEESFCCNGLEDECWQEVIAEGLWDWTLEEVREMITERLAGSSDILVKGSRFFVEKHDNGTINMLCVLRDTDYQYDLKISCFNKKEGDE